MLSFLNTAERAGKFVDINNYVLNRHVIAYNSAKQYIGKVVLELGCGNGYGMKLLADQVDAYIGIDKYTTINPPMASKTAIFKAELPLLDNIGDNSFDSAICFQVIEHIEDDKTLLKEIKRVLKPGGKLLLTTPNILTTLTRNPYHVREYTPTEMKNVVATAFDNFEIKGVYGNEKVMKYYNANKESVAKILKWDIFKLEKNLPAGLVKIPYNIMNNLNRKKLYDASADLTSSITADDFYLDTLTDEALDYFVIGTK